MKFRPCIDIHDGKVKQIVGKSLTEEGKPIENFVSSYDADYFASVYKEKDLPGGHVIILNSKGTQEYEMSKAQAKKALMAYPGGLAVGGGIDIDNADEFLKSGASHVIVTSYVFKDGRINMEALEKLSDKVTKKRLILDLSCKKKDDGYYITTDRWTKFTDVLLNKDTLNMLSEYCDEFLVHASDVEGMSKGIEQDVVKILTDSPIPVTYAGGVHKIDDLALLRRISNGKVDVTIGSALDIFGGNLKMNEIIEFIKG